MINYVPAPRPSELLTELMRRLNQVTFSSSPWPRLCDQFCLSKIISWRQKLGRVHRSVHTNRCSSDFLGAVRGEAEVKESDIQGVHIGGDRPIRTVTFTLRGHVCRRNVMTAKKKNVAGLVCDP